MKFQTNSSRVEKDRFTARDDQRMFVVSGKADGEGRDPFACRMREPMSVGSAVVVPGQTADIARNALARLARKRTFRVERDCQQTWMNPC